MFTLGGLLLLTAILAGVTALVALPLREARERQLLDETRLQMAALLWAVEEFRAREYRLPDRVEELESVGYSLPAAIDACRFVHRVDVRNFEDHLEIVLKHRSSESALAQRYPAAGGAETRPAPAGCDSAGGER